MTLSPETQRWVIDSIEEGVASVEVDGTTMITVPLWLLPRGVKQGLILAVRHERPPTDAQSALRLDIDEAATSRARAASAAQVNKGSRQANDPGGNISF